MSRAIKLKLKDYEYLYNYERYGDMKLKGEELKLGKLLVDKLQNKEMDIDEISSLFNKNKQETENILLAIQADFPKISLDYFLIENNGKYKLSDSFDEIEEYWFQIQKFTNLTNLRSVSLFYIQENIKEEAKKEQKAKTKSKE